MKTTYARIQKQIAFIYFFLFSFLFADFSHAQSSYAISMNGTSTSYADLGTVSPAGNFSTGLTVECWVKWGAFNSWSRLLDIGNGTASDNILLANQSTSNNFRFEVYAGSTGSGISGPNNLVTGRWYHVAATVDGSGNARIYVDGIQVVSGIVNVPANVSRTTCYIGKSNWGADAYLNGVVDEMRIWNVARTQTQIKQYMFKSVDPATSGLVAYYHCDENGGTTLTNSTSGAGAGNGTTQPGLSWTASPIQFAANALNFDGTNDYVNIPYVVNSDFTVEYWMKTSSTGPGGTSSQWWQGNGIVDAEESGAFNDWGTSLTGSYLAFGIGNPDITIHSTSVVNTGAWVHVAATWQQSTGQMILYINGTQEATGTGNTDARSGTRITLGEIQTNIQFFSGDIDEVRIWNSVRTQAQIQANMNGEIDPNSADASTLAAYYTFNQNIASGNNTGVVILIDQKGTNNGTLNNMAMTGSTSNFVQQSGSLVVLPVRLISFAAERRSNGVQLTWSTATEQNAADFMVQRSKDGRSWTTLTVLPAAGNSNEVLHYSYLDAAPAGGANYYRLQLRDKDGQSTWSNILIVTISEQSRSFLVKNPVVTNGRLFLQVNQPMVLQLYTMDGRMVWSNTLESGYQVVELNGYAKGIYLLKGAASVERIVVQ